jgi:S1-C subfamily serine protease
MNIGNGSALDKSGLQIGDVIIGAEGKEIDNIDKLLKIYEEAESKGTLKLLIFRNQSELVLTIKTE